MNRLFSQSFALTSLPLLLVFLISCTASNQVTENNEAGGSIESLLASQSKTVAFTHVNVVPMTSEQVLPNQTVLIQEGYITTIGPSDKVKVPKKALEIDATDKYLMPGLAEMHAHIPVPSEAGDAIVRETMMLWLANGITTVRGMLGAPYHLQLKEQVETGAILGPRIYTSSPSLNGKTVQSEDDAQIKVVQYALAGYDFLKIHPGIQLEHFRILAETADREKIRFAGHVPLEVGIRRALAARYASIDHIDGYLEGLVEENEETEAGSNGFFGMGYVDIADRSKIQDLALMTKEQQVWVVPTQSLMVRWPSPTLPDMMVSQSPETRYMDADIIENWKTQKKKFQEAPGYSTGTYENFISIRNEILMGLHEAGVDFLLGSDSPQVFNVPGFSIHHEISSLEDAGIPIYDILLSGTHNPARFFGVPNAYGTVTVGTSADLILLDNNPLQDTDNLKQPAGVMTKGRWLSRKLLDEELEKIAAKYE